MVTDIRPFQIGRTRAIDVRHLFPPTPGGAVIRLRSFDQLRGIAVHHDGVMMPAGDQDFDGSTLDEDLGRLNAIYQQGRRQGWGGFPYHFVASPNGRLFYTLDVRHLGAHVARRNHELVGLALMGDFTMQRPTPEEICAGGLGVVGLWLTYGRLLGMKGHWEWALPAWPTQCPGEPWVDWQRDLLLAAAFQGRVAFPDA